MPDLTPRQLLACAALAVLVVVLGLGRLGGGGGGRDNAAGAAPAIKVSGGAGDEGARVVVHVAGAVRRPGVYRLQSGARVQAAVRLAGGATRRADLGGLNLAAKVEDGRQVLVPERVGAGAGATTAAATTAAGPPGAPAQPINLNTATLQQLDTLPGVGPATAQKILDFRKERGGFGSVEDLGEVPGIGPVRMAALREAVTV